MFIFKTSVVLILRIISQFLPWRMWGSNFNYFVRTAETELHTISVCGGETVIKHTHICVPVTDVHTLKAFPGLSLHSQNKQAEKVTCAESRLSMWLIPRPQVPSPPSCSHRLFILGRKDYLDQFWREGWQRTQKHHNRVLPLGAGSIPEVRVLEEWGGAMQGRKQQCLNCWKQALQHFVLSLNRSFHIIHFPA